MLTSKQLIQEVRRLAQANPNNVYVCPADSKGRCFYEKGTCTDGSVGCIFGQAFKNLGCPQEGREIIGVVIKSICENPTDLEIDWVNRVQMKQDIGNTWADAIKAADEKYGKLFPLDS